MNDTANRAKVRLCVVEKQEIFRKLYRSVFENGFDVELLDGALDEDQAADIASRLKPDVLLVSALRLEKGITGGISAIKRASPRTGVVLLVLACGHHDVEEMRQLVQLNTGGMALFLKQSIDLTEQLIGIINAVYHGQVVLDPELTAKLLSERTECPFLRLVTSREQEILHLLANGYTNAAIAEILVIDLKTVEHHINSLYSKLRTVIDFSDRHPRVHAARLYLEATGKLPSVGGMIGAGEVRV